MIPCEATSSSVSQEIPHILWSTKLHHRIDNSPPPVPILCQIHPFKTPKSSLLKIHFNSHKKSNQMQQCIKILFHIYMKLNVFRATHRPSPGA